MSRIKRKQSRSGRHRNPPRNPRTQKWVGGRLLAPAYITEEQPYRPEMVLWLELPDDIVVSCTLVDPNGPSVAFGKSLLDAMESPLAGLSSAAGPDPSGRFCIGRRSPRGGTRYRCRSGANTRIGSGYSSHGRVLDGLRQRRTKLLRRWAYSIGHYRSALPSCAVSIQDRPLEGGRG